MLLGMGLGGQGAGGGARGMWCFPVPSPARSTCREVPVGNDTRKCCHLVFPSTASRTRTCPSESGLFSLLEVVLGGRWEGGLLVSQACERTEAMELALAHKVDAEFQGILEERQQVPLS